MIMILYFIIAFITFFIMFKKYKHKVEDYTSRSCTLFIESIYAWYIALTSIFWIIAIPCIVSWIVMDFIYNKIIK